MRKQAGFTLIELMIYTGLTAVIIGLFAGILITATRIQGEQGSSAQVTQELNFLMTSIKRYVSSAVSYTVITPTQLQLTSDHGTTQTVTYLAPLKIVDLTEDDGTGNPQTSQLS